ncbi:30S ribosomal protein S6 [uncultured Paludibacter sp.]|nr:30S ribosomal protein S6 [uncultured Paludibacter sp.]
MLNHYEAVFILTPVLSDAQMKEAVEKFKTVITDNGGTILNEENWGMRKLAYTIQKKSTGFYTLLQFDAEPTLIATLETQFRRDERVLRFLTFRLDKYAFEYAEKRKNAKSQPKEVKEPKVKEVKVEKEESVEEKED